MLLGDDDIPLPNKLGTITKYRDGSNAMSSPIIGSLPVWLEPKNVGNTITLSRLAFSTPKVLYASLAPRNVRPDCKTTSPSS